MDKQCTLAELATQTSQAFRNHFGRAATWLAAAPGRVNLIGEHTDYNDGFVLPMAIERYVVIAADQSSSSGTEDVVHIYSELVGEQQEFSLGRSDNRIHGALTRSSATDDSLSKWARYVQGTIATMASAGISPSGFDAMIGSNVPLGGGLSSSAALEVATATLLEGMTGQSIEPVAKALLCQRAEHEAVGVPCGIMDQFSSMLCQTDHLMLLDCRNQQIEMIPFTDPDITVLVTNSNVKHELTGGEYAQRRRQCEAAANALGVASLRDVTMKQLEQSKPQLEVSHYQRARHVVGEIERTRQAADAIGHGAWDEVGRLMIASHASLRDDYQVSCKELDLLVDLALELGPSQGVIGSRMTGGGFGGCTVSLVRTGQVDHVANTMANRYQQQVGIEASPFTTRPARGAHMILSRP
jgi:galactokinase